MMKQQEEVPLDNKTGNDSFTSIASNSKPTTAASTDGSGSTQDISSTTNGGSSSAGGGRGNNNKAAAKGGNAGNNHNQRSRSVVWGRGIFVGFLVIVAVSLALGAYFTLYESEYHLVEEQYYSMTARALEATKSLATNKLQHGTMIMAKMASYEFPNAADWPFVWMEGYFDVVASIIPTSCYTGMHLVPIIPPSKVEEFEDFAYWKFAQAFGPNTTAGAQSHFGKGIWVQDSSINTSDHRYHDTTGVSIHGSPYDMIAPKFQHAYGDKSSYVMMNVHGFKTQSQALDATINCTNFERPDDPTKSCQALSTMHPPLIHNPAFGDKGVFAFFSTPIYPKNDPNTLVGFIFAAIWWVEVMEEVFPQEAEGIDCVLTASQEQQDDDIHSFTIRDGSGVYLGKGDLHDSKWDRYEMETLLIDDPQDKMANNSAVYTLKCYPNDDFPTLYQTKNPTMAAVGAIVIIVLTSLLFFLYDKFVYNEVHTKADLLESKRQFVRFVSHEVRTPLNSVCMGLTLLTEEMATSFGFGNGSNSTAEEGGEVLLSSNKVSLFHNNKNMANGGGGSNSSSSAAAAEQHQQQLPHQRENSNNNSSIQKKKTKIEEWFKLANEVQVNAQCAVDVLNDLLNYDKVESGELQLEFTVVSIWNLIERTVTEFQLPMASKNIKLHFQLPIPENDQEKKGILLEGQKVIGDTVRLTQVLRNLVSNAIKFTPEHGDIYIEAKWRRKEDHDTRLERTLQDSKHAPEPITCCTSGELVLTVRDTGAGMTKDQLNRLFGKGVQFNVNELQHGNGSGLGLYIAMGIVQQHEGTLACDSEGLGQGTTFTMTVPLYDLSSHESTSACTDKMDPKHGDGGNGSGGGVICFQDSKLRILIVDDVASNRKLLGRLLSTKGHESDQAEDGAIGYELVKQAQEKGNQYDLVILDYEMPNLNGPETAKKIRGELGCDVFIVGVTGNLMPEDVSYFQSMGANAVLGKPIRIADLESLIFENHITRGMTQQMTPALMSSDGSETGFTVTCNSSVFPQGSMIFEDEQDC